MANAKTKIAVLSTVAVLLVLAMVLSIAMFAGSNSTAYTPDSNIQLDNTAINSSTNAPKEVGSVEKQYDYIPSPAETGDNVYKWGAITQSGTGNFVSNSPTNEVFTFDGGPRQWCWEAYMLMEDITINSLFTSNDNGGYAGKFYGILDGNGHTITIDASSSGDAELIGGLFSKLEKNADQPGGGIIRNLTVVINNLSWGSNRSSTTILGGLVGIATAGARIENVKVIINTNATLGTNYYGGENAWLYNNTQVSTKNTWYMAVGGMVGESQGTTFQNICIENNATGAGVSVCTWHSRGSAGIFQNYQAPRLYVGGMVGMVCKTYNTVMNNITLKGEGIVRAQDERNNGGTDQYVGGLIGANCDQAWVINGLIYDYSTASIKNSNIDVKGGKNDVTSGLASFNDSSAKLGHFIAEASGVTFSNVFVANTRTLGYVTGATNTGWSFPTYDPALTPRFDGNDNIAIAINKATYDSESLVSQVILGSDKVDVLTDTLITDTNPAGTIWYSASKSINLISVTLANKYTLVKPVGLTAEYTMSSIYNATVPVVESVANVYGSTTSSGTNVSYTGLSSANADTYTLSANLSAYGTKYTYNGKNFYIANLGEMQALYLVEDGFDLSRTIQYTINQAPISIDVASTSITYMDSLSAIAGKTTASVSGTLYNGATVTVAEIVADGYSQSSPFTPADASILVKIAGVTMANDDINNYAITYGNGTSTTVQKLSLAGAFTSVPSGLVYAGQVLELNPVYAVDGYELTFDYSYSGKNTIVKDAGDYTVTATCTDSSIELTDNTADFSVAPAKVSITAGSATGHTYDGITSITEFAQYFTAPYGVGEEAQSPLAIATSAVIKGTETSATSLLNADTYTITATLADESGNYTADSFAVDYVISPMTVNGTLTADDLIYNGQVQLATFEFAEGSELKNGDEMIINHYPDTEAMASIEPKDAGTYFARMELPAYAQGKYNYVFAEGVETEIEFTINQRTINVALADKETVDFSKTYDNTAFLNFASLFVIAEADETTGIVAGENVTLTYSAGQDVTVLNADTYTITASLDSEAYPNYTLAGTTTAEYTIEQAPIGGAFDSITVFDYDGTNKALTFTIIIGSIFSDAVVVSYKKKNAEGIYEDMEGTPLNAGEYMAVASLKEYAPGLTNFKWGKASEEEGAGETVTQVAMTINKADNAINGLSIAGWTYGQVANAPSITSATYGKDSVVYSYAKKVMVEGEAIYEPIEGVPTLAGEYKVIATIPASENYNEVTAEQEFAIAKAQVTGEWTEPSSFVYDKNAKAYTFSGEKTTIKYYQYNNNTSSYDIALDNAPINAGSYKAVVVLEDTDNYEFGEVETEKTFEITKVQLTVSWSNTSMTYNGSAQLPVASVTALDGENIQLKVVGDTAINVGTTYNASVSIVDNEYSQNYELVASSVETTFSITAIEITGSWSELSAQDLVYDGSQKVYTFNISSGEGLGAMVGLDQITVEYAQKTSDGYADATATAPINAGTYKAIAVLPTFDEEGNSNYVFAEGTSDYVEFVITKAQIEKPTLSVDEFTYNGTEQSIALQSTDDYTIGGTTSATIVGNYQATATLTDKDNTEWADSASTDDLTFDWSINKAQAVVNVVIADGPYYEGYALPAISLGENSTNGTIAWTTTDQKLSTSQSEYAWTFTSSDSNYADATGNVEIQVTAIVVTSIKATYNQPQQVNIYTNTSLDTLKQYLTVETINNDSTLAGTLTSEDYTLSVNDNNKFVSGKNIVTVTYVLSEETSLTTTFEVEVLEVAISSISVEKNDDFKAQYTYGDEFFKDGIVVKVNYNNGDVVVLANDDYTVGALNAGMTSVLVTYSVGDKNYTASVDGFTVAKKSVEVPQVSGSYTYNMTEQTADISTSDLYELSGQLKGTDAGTYTITATLTDSDNYAWASSETASVEIEWTIAQAQATLQAVEEKVNVEYSGTTFTSFASLFTVTGVDGDTVNVVYAVEDGKTVKAVGTYTITATVSDDNYAEKSVSVTYTIDKKNITPTISVGSNIKYDGTQKVATITFPGVIAGEELTATLLYNGEASAVNAGEYTVTISAVGGANADNYEVNTEVGATLTIVARELTVTWTNAGNYTYTGEAIAPTYSVANLIGSDKVTATISGDNISDGQAINAGDYTMTLALPNSNYKFANSNTAEYTIDKLVVTVNVSAQSKQITYGTEYTLSASDFASVSVNGNGFVASLTASYDNGSYTLGTNAGTTLTATLSVSVTKNQSSVDASNYEVVGLDNAQVSIEVIKAQPVISIEVSLSEDLGGGNKFTTDHKVSDLVATNNGTKGTVEITTEDAQLLKGKNTIAYTFTPSDSTNYNSYSGTVEISVADASLSKITVELNGEKKQYTAGEVFDKSTIIVKAYYGDSDETGTQVDAGDYTVSVTNVDMTTDKIVITYGGFTAELTKGEHYDVVKRQIAQPTVSTTEFTYNGTAQGISLVGTDDYTIGGTTSATNADDYTATVALKDTTNTEWAQNAGTEDLTFSWSIKAKEVTLTISSVSKDYDGQLYTQSIEVDGTEEFIASDKVTVSVSITNNSADAGVYKLVITTSADSNANYDITRTENATLTIYQAVVTTPVSPENLVFNGKTQTADFEPNDLYTVSGNTGMDADTYTATFTLKNSKNYKWSTSEEPSVTVEWTIDKADATLSAVKEQVNVDYTGAVFNNYASLFSVAGVEGDVLSVEYAVESGLTIENVGTYTITATINDSNYNTATAQVTYTVEQKDINLTISSVSKTYDGTIYDFSSIKVNGNEFAKDDNITVSVSSSEATENVGSYALTINVEGDEEVLKNYNITKTTDAKLTINAKSLTVNWSSTVSFEYNGKAQAPTASVVTGVADETLTLDIAISNTVDNQAINKGDYRATASTTNANYTLTNTTCDFSITAKSIAVEWSGTSFVYNGSEQAPSASVETGIDGETIELTVAGAQTVVGADYTATASMTEANSNYVLTNTTCKFSITKMQIAKPSPAVQNFTYTGTEQEYVIAASDYYTVSGNKGTNADDYTATVALSDKANTEWATNAGVDDLTFDWSIAKKDATITANAIVKTYGQEIDEASAQVTGTVNNEELEYTIAIEQAEVYAVGTYDITVILTEGSKVNANYNITIKNAELTINKATATLTANSSTVEVVYNGEVFNDYASLFTVKGVADDVVSVEYSLSGLKPIQDAGTYTITASVNDDNYEFATAQVTYTVTALQVTVTVSNSNKNVVYGTEYSLTASDFATAEITNSQDFTAEVSVEYVDAEYEVGTNAGTVFNALLSVSVSGVDAGNYTVAEYTEEVTVTVTKATNAIQGELTIDSWTYGEEAKAHSVVTADFGDVVYTYEGTNGTVYNSSEVPTNAGSYKLVASVADTTNYEGAVAETEFTIAKATATLTSDSSTVEVVYNGEVFDDYASLFTVAGVNEDVVNVVYAVADSKTIQNADTYTITATISDSNYEEKSASVTYIIAKKQITKPSVSTSEFEYNGTEQGITLAQSSDYTISGTTIATNAGSYQAVVALSDKANTEWADETTDDLTFAWSIAKKQITKPEVEEQSFTYTGTEQEYVIATSDYYTVSGNKATNAGDYTATVALSDKANTEWADETTSDLTFDWTIAKKDATITANAIVKTYGQEIGEASAVVTGTVNNEELEYTIAIAQADEYVVGTYDITVTLTEGSEVNANYNITIKNAELTINKARVELDGTIAIEDWTYGDDANAPSGVTTNFGTVVYEYATSQEGEYTVVVPENAGTYYVRATVAGTVNYDGATSSAVSFTIAKMQIAKPSPAVQNFTYTGSELTYVIASSDYYTVTGNKATNAGDYTATVALSDKANTEWADKTTSDLTFDWTIAKATREINATIKIGYKTLTINVEGDKEGAVYSLDGITFKPMVDVISVEIESEYTIYVKYNETANYTASPEKTLTATMTKTILKEFISENFGEIFGFADIAKYDELTELAQVATGEDAEFDSAYADLTAKKTALLEGAKADVEEALTAGAKLAGYEVAVAVAMTLTTLGAGIAMATMAMRRKGGKKND